MKHKNKKVVELLHELNEKIDYQFKALNERVGKIEKVLAISLMGALVRGKESDSKNLKKPTKDINQPNSLSNLKENITAEESFNIELTPVK